MAVNAGTLADATQAAVDSLKKDLRDAGVADSAALQAFVAKYAGISASWTMQLANAKLAGNEVDIDRYSNDLKGVNDLAIADAAIAALNLQAKVEQDLADFILKAIQAALLSLL